MRDRRGAYEIAPPRVRGARGLLRCSGVSGCGSKAAKRSRQTNRECVPLVRRARCPARYRRSARSLVGFRRVVVPIVVVASDGRSTPNPNTPSEGLMRYGIRDEKRPFQDVLDTRVRDLRTDFSYKRGGRTRASWRTHRRSEAEEGHGTWGASKWCLDIIYILLVTAEQVLHGRRLCVWGDRRVFPNLFSTLFTGHYSTHFS